MIKVADTSLSDLCAFADELADAAGAIACSGFRSPMVVERKADRTPVTEIDRQIETLLRQMIGARYPTHGITGEEFPDHNPDAPFVWILDPIDGTKSFISGIPTFGLLLAVLAGRTPVFGMIDMPVLGERWSSFAGGRTMANGLPCATSSCSSLADAIVLATSPDQFTPSEWTSFERVSGQARLRRFGGDCYAYGLLASGHVDLVMEAELQPYDFLALVRVVEDAGGLITDWQGQALDRNSGGRILAAANASLHAEALAFIAEEKSL